MIRHHDLWSYASQELELGDHRFVSAHLEDCPECKEQLGAVQLAQQALELARQAQPAQAWGRMDERIGAMVEKRLQAQARRPLYWRLGFVGVGLALAATAVLVLTLPKPELPRVAMEQPGPPSSSWARVDRAQGLTRMDAEQTELVDGTELRGGDVLRTASTGRAFVHLPDGSHMRVGGASQVALTRAETDDVALTLERGTLAVRASHQERKGFVVHSGGLTVNVVGTVFGVTNDAQQVEVAVTEGRVRVELPSGESLFVESGTRLRFDPKTQRTKRLKVNAGMERELSELTAVADATVSVEQRAVVPAVGGTPSAPPMLSAQGTPRNLPRLSSAEARARQVEPPVVGEPAPVVAPAPVEQKKVDIVIQEPEQIWPSIGGGEVIRGIPPKREPEVVVEAPPVSQPTEWAEAPKPNTEEWASLPAAAPAKLATGKDLEVVFLERAEASVEQGTCEKFQAGLEDLAEDPKSPRAELARVLRARCFESQLRPGKAIAEYRKYLEAFPRGKFVAEANQALGE